VPPKRLKRFHRHFPGVGVIRRSSGTRKAGEFHARDAVLTKLWKADRLDLLRDFRDAKISINELMDLDRRGILLRATAQDAVTHRPLWEVARALLPRMGTKGSTRQRYAGILARLEARKLLGERPTLAQLPAFDWPTLRKRWPGGPSDWNHVGRTLSRLLTLALGHKHHELRLEFQRVFPKEREVERMPDMTSDTFWRVLAEIREPLRPIYVCLVATGMRINEYLACRRHHLKPETRHLMVPGTKTHGSADSLPIAEAYWPWVDAAIPSPIQVDAIRAHWTAAQRAAGLEHHHTLHDLRHLTGQLLADAGLSDAAIGRFLRHAAPQSVRRYSQRRLRAADAELLATQLGTTHFGTHQGMEGHRGQTA
jgi:integrase